MRLSLVFSLCIERSRRKNLTLLGNIFFHMREVYELRIPPSEEGGVLTIVQVLEEGSLLSKEHAVGALLTMCESDRAKYREIILKEGVIPGLLELTVRGTPRARGKARELLTLLRNSACTRPEMEADTLENIVSNIVSRIDGDDTRMEKAKKMLAEMVQVSMEQSLRHLQQRASW